MHVYTCTKCKNPKREDEMSKDKNRHNGISSWCKQCRRVMSFSRKKRNPESVARQKSIKALRYAELNTDQPEAAYMKRRGITLKHRYGMSLEDYDVMLSAQSECCAICERPASDLTYLLRVDHCHESGEVRGLLCVSCNGFLGAIKDRVELLHRAIYYLTNKKQTPSM